MKTGAAIRTALIWLPWILAPLFSAAQQNPIHVRIFQTETEAGTYRLYDEKMVSDSASLILYLEKNKNHFISRSYLATGYDSIRVTEGKVTAWLVTGKRFSWEQLTITVLDDSVPLRFKPKNIERRNPGEAENEQSLRNIVEYYENLGYPFCSARFDSISENNGRLSATVLIEPGEYIVFDSLILKGNHGVKPRFLNLYLNFKPGTAYSENYIKRMDVNLRNIGFLTLNKPPELAFDQKSCDISLYLSHKKTSTFSGVIGFLPDNRNTGKLLLTGDVDLFLENLTGRGENMSLKWLRYQAQSQQLQTAVYYPYFLNSRIGIQAAFDLQKQDSTYISTRTRAGVRYLLNASNGINLYYEYFSSFPLGNTDQQLASNSGDVNTSLMGLGLVNSRVDYLYNPRKGYSVNTEASAGLRNAGSEATGSNRLLIKFMGDFKFYIPLANRITFLQSLTAGGIYGSQLFENELFLTGGLKNLRGFDENSIIAGSYAYLNSELRFLFERNSAFFVFCNYGFVDNPLAGDNRTDYPIGFGTGVNMKTKAGIFSLVYALGSWGGNPPDFRASKIHFGYISRF